MRLGSCPLGPAHVSQPHFTQASHPTFSRQNGHIPSPDAGPAIFPVQGPSLNSPAQDTASALIAPEVSRGLGK